MSKQTIHTPFRGDVVGSFLRPEELKKARASFAKGETSEAKLRAIEDELITSLVAKEKAHGIKAFTDGEFRRSYWHLDFMWGFQGIEHIELEHGYQFHGEETTKGSIKLVGKISGANHPFVQDYAFVHQLEEEGFVARQTIPAPAQLLAELFRGNNTRQTMSVYPDLGELIADIAKAYRQVIADLYAAGCRNLQLDDCTWGMFCDQHYWESRQKEGIDFKEEAEKYLKVNNLALENRPADLTITSHICRGNYHSTYACEGSYDPVAPFVFAQEHVDAFYLEYDDHRSGDFAALRFIPDNVKVVLGLITTKVATLEDKAAIIARIREAEQYIPLERLYLSPQCGFASCEIGNKLSEQQQWAKVDLVQQIAKEVWG